MVTTSKVSGTKDVRRNLEQTRQQLRDKILDLVQVEAGIVLDRSKQLVGKDTRELEKSGKIASVVQTPTETSAVITYGDPDPYYAVYAHEKDQANNKYLERALRERADKTGREFIEAIRAAVIPYFVAPPGSHE